MEPVCRIVADVHEVPSEIPARLRVLDVAVTVEPLQVGDYDVGSRVIVERKSAGDLHESLRRGRLWPQLGRLRSTARTPCLLIEGVHLSGPISSASIKGALLAASDLGILVVRSTSRSDTADWLVALARRSTSAPVHRVRPAYAQRAQPLGADIPQAMLAAVPGISAMTARRLLHAFGSVARVLAASDGELMRVEGMGPQRVQALRKAAS
jgi:Fanconi anemia group M protein